MRRRFTSAEGLVEGAQLAQVLRLERRPRRSCRGPGRARWDRVRTPVRGGASWHINHGLYQWPLMLSGSQAGCQGDLGAVPVGPPARRPLSATSACCRRRGRAMRRELVERASDGPYSVQDRSTLDPHGNGRRRASLTLRGLSGRFRAQPIGLRRRPSRQCACPSARPVPDPSRSRVPGRGASPSSQPLPSSAPQISPGRCRPAGDMRQMCASGQSRTAR